MILVIGATGACLATLVSTWVVRRLALRFGVVARPAADRWHRRDVPLLGGVALVLHEILRQPHLVRRTPEIPAAEPLHSRPALIPIGGR